MKANKRIRDLDRRSDRRLTFVSKDGLAHGGTTFPLVKKDKNGKQRRVRGLKIEWKTKREATR